MGTDFIRKIAKSFKKGLDKHRVDLATPTLFTQHPVCTARLAVADILDKVRLNEGDPIIVKEIDSGLVAMCGLSVVAHFINPPADVVSAVHASFGVALGKIKRVHPLSGVVEILVC